MQNRRSFFAFALVLLTASAAESQQLYSNFPVNGLISAFQVNAGYSVSNSFTLSGSGTAGEVSFGAWLTPGDSVTGVSWALGTTAFDTSLGSGVAGATSSYNSTNADGFDVDTVTFALPGVSLPAGTYYLTLSAATSAGSNPVYWDINNAAGQDAWTSGSGHVSASNTCFQVVGISGTCASSFQILSTNASVAPSPSSLTFSNQVVNTTSTAQVVTITNNGAGAATISGIAVTGANAVDFGQTNNCPASLTANAFCTVSVTFTPQSATTFSAAVTITGSSPLSVPLSGTGIVTAPPSVTLAPAISFPNQTVNTTSTAQNVTLTNNGPGALTISSIGIGGTNPTDFAQTNNCPASPATLAASAFCTISVTFTPQAANSYSATITVADNGVNSPQSVGLSGTGVPVQYMLTTAVNPAGEGTISPASGLYAAGSVVSVSATANPGYAFTGFSGALTGSTNPQNLTINGAATVTANFNGWYANGGTWSNRKAITISHAQVAATLSGFPVLISITDANLQSIAQANGNDILFTAADGLTKLNDEIDQYNGTTGQLVAWVNIPSLSNTADTTLYMYYGNPSSGSQQNAAAVWSSYAAVYHLPNGTTLTTGDSTANANNLAASGSPGPVAATGEIGGAASWNGSTQHGIQLARNTTLDPGNGSMTASVWLKTTSANGLDMFDYYTYPGASWRLYFNGKAQLRTSDGTHSVASPLSAALNDGNWHYVVGVVDRTGGNVLLYVDGSLVGSSAVGALGNLTNASALLEIAQGPITIETNPAVMDEAHYVVGTALSAGWISTEYKNQSAPASFLSVGPQQNQP